jgi:glyoxylase-like metal-dependent hydrolase (beta-lactamase superfamily II)
VNTHGHIDHIGGNYQFESVFLSSMDQELAMECLAREVKEKVLKSICEDDIPACFDNKKFMDYSLENVTLFHGEKEFDLGGITVSTVSIPTHTRGSVGLLCREKKLLFSGDAIAPCAYLLFPEACSLAGYIDMLQKISESDAFDSIICSHSERLINKNEMKLYMKCAEEAPKHKCISYRDPIFPDIVGKKYVYSVGDSADECAAIIYHPSKI